MKIDRLISIIMVLLKRDKISANELAVMFEVSTRTIYRDVEAINQAGIPITTQMGVNGGISIMAQYKVDKKLFSSSDIATLMIGLSSLSSTIASHELATTMAKVKGLIPEHQHKDITFKANQVVIDFTAWNGHNNLQSKLDTIKIALNKNQILQLHYIDSQQNTSIRNVEPYQLVLKDRHWYLQAYCLLRLDFRLFKLYRIAEMQFSTAQFIPREFQAKPLHLGLNTQDFIPIRLKLHKSQREVIAEYCDEENIKPYDKDNYLVEMLFINNEVGYQLLMSLGDHCECLAPDEIRQELVQRINAMLMIYSGK